MNQKSPQTETDHQLAVQGSTTQDPGQPPAAQPSSSQSSSAHGAEQLDVRVRRELRAASAWIAPTATVVGNVTLGEQASVWFGAVVRGDCEAVTIGPRSNVQDLCCLHADPGFPCTIGADVTIGHAAVVHGATVEDEVLIGIRATVLNGARIGAGSLIGAAALVTEGALIPPRSLVLGVPGKVVRQLTDGDVERIRRGSQHYVAAAAQFKLAESEQA
jgi:carbonic anhydrase/acetyltransferase-like protein (isoleucine patch superfamily)